MQLNAELYIVPNRQSINFIFKKDRLAIFIDMHEIHVETSLKYTTISNTKYICCLYTTQPTK